MNNRTSFALLAVLTAVGTLTMSTAYASEDLPQACVGCSMEDARAAAKQMLLDDTPVNVWTDKTTYGHNDMIMVKASSKCSFWISSYNYCCESQIQSSQLTKSIF